MVTAENEGVAAVVYECADGRREKRKKKGKK